MRGFIKISTKRSRTKVCGLPLPAADIRVIREWKLVFYLESGNTLPEDKNAFPWTKEAHHIDRKGMKTKKRDKRWDPSLQSSCLWWFILIINFIELRNTWVRKRPLQVPVKVFLERITTKDPSWVRTHHLMGWEPEDNKTEKESTSCWWILPFTLSSSPPPSYNLPLSRLLWGKQLCSTVWLSDIQHCCCGQDLHLLEAMKPQKPWTKTDPSSLGCMRKKMSN